MKPMFYLKIRLLFVTILVAIFGTACGGGSSGGESSDQEQVADVSQSNDQTEDTGNGESTGGESTGGESTGGESNGQTDLETVESGNATDENITENEEQDAAIDGSNASTTQPPFSENTPDNAGASLQIWSAVDSTTGIEAFDYDINADGVVGGLGRLNFEDVLFVGSLNSYTPLIREGDILPGDRPNTVVAEFDGGKTGIGSNGTLITLVRLEGAQPGFALVTASEDEIKVVAKSGQQISPSNGQPFEIDFFEDAVVGGNDQVLFSVKGPRPNDRILLLYANDTFTILAEAGSRYLNADAEPTTASTGCSIVFTTDTIGFSADSNSIFSTGAAFPSALIMDDGTVLFNAVLGGTSCPTGRHIISFRNGVYETLDIPVNEVLNPVERDSRFLSLLGVTIDNRLVLSGVADSDVFSVANVDVVWDFSFQQGAKMLFAEGESVQSPDERYIIEDTDFNGLIRNDISFNSVGQYSMRLQLENEEVIFVGSPRDELPYSDFDAVGESSLEYRVGTAAFLPSPYSENDFFYSIEPLRLLNNGDLLFFGFIENAATNEANVIPGLWRVDSEGTLKELTTLGEELPVVNSSSAFSTDFIGRVQASTLLDSGQLMFRVTGGVSGSDAIISYKP